MPPQTSSPGSLDPQAVALAKAIRQSESGGDPTARGASGEFGAYQYTPETWAKDSAEAEVNAPLQQSTLEQQNQVAYTQIKKWKDAGYNPGQIASMWNAGEGEPNAYLGKFSNGQSSVGTNKLGVHFDVPKYAKSVATAYQTLKGGGVVSKDPNNPSSAVQDQQPSSLGQELGQRGTAIAGALTQGAQGVAELSKGDYAKGAEDTASGALQTVGGAAGAVGDVVQKGVEMIPGVKSVEEGIGTVLGGLANTSFGKEITGSISSFVQAHPEAAKNIGAVANIASVIPMFKGVSLLLGGAKDAVGLALRGSLTKAAGNEIESVASRTIGGRALLSTAEAKGIDPIKTILESGALPEVQTDAAGAVKYSTQDAVDAMTTKAEEDALQAKLGQLDTTKVANRVDLNEIKNNALAVMKKEFADRTDYDAALSQTEAIFNSYIARNGQYISLSKLNDIKRGIRDSVNWKMPIDKLTGDLHYNLGQSVAKDVEAKAEAAKIPGVSEINKVMSAKIEARKLLKMMDGRPVKVTRWGKWARKVKMGLGAGAGEMIGSSLGVPFAGTIAGGLLESGASRPITPLTRLANSGGRVQQLTSLAKTAPLGLLRGVAGTQPNK